MQKATRFLRRPVDLFASWFKRRFAVAAIAQCERVPNREDVRRRGSNRPANLGFLLMAAVGVVLGGSAVQGEEWPQWGGPRRDFKVTSGILAENWPPGGPKVLWERELGPGYSAIAAVRGRLYTSYRDGDDEVIVALDAKSGQTIWEHKYKAPTLEGQVLDFGKGPNASPLVLDNRVITVGFTGKMHCLSLDDGKPIWSRDLVKDFNGKAQEFGYSSSPLLYKGNVITLVGGDKHGVVAFNPKDGSLVWGSEPHDISYASPKIITVSGWDQIVFFSSEAVIGLDALTGKKLWDHPVVNEFKNNATDAIWDESKNLLWAATQIDGATRALKLTRLGDTMSVEQVWFNPKVQVFHWNAVQVGDYVYGSIGGQITHLAAVDIRTGEVKWKERGYQKALCVFADGKLISLDENGMLRLARVSPRGVDALGSHQLTEKVSWTAPTLVGTTLYVRDTKRIMALELGE